MNAALYCPFGQPFVRGKHSEFEQGGQKTDHGMPFVEFGPYTKPVTN